MCIERSGGPFVKGLRRVIRDAQIGALLIQSDNLTGEPLLFHTSVPDSIKGDTSADTTVFLMDAQISTGAAAIMAIRVMLDHGVQGEKQRSCWFRLGSLIALASLPTNRTQYRLFDIPRGSPGSPCHIQCLSPSPNSSSFQGSWH